VVDQFDVQVRIDLPEEVGGVLQDSTCFAAIPFAVKRLPGPPPTGHAPRRPRDRTSTPRLRSFSRHPAEPPSRRDLRAVPGLISSRSSPGPPRESRYPRTNSLSWTRSRGSRTPPSPLGLRLAPPVDLHPVYRHHHSRAVHPDGAVDEYGLAAGSSSPTAPSAPPRVDILPETHGDLDIPHPRRSTAFLSP